MRQERRELWRWLRAPVVAVLEDPRWFAGVCTPSESHKPSKPRIPASFTQGLSFLYIQGGKLTQDSILIDLILSLQYGRFSKTPRESNQAWDGTLFTHELAVWLPVRFGQHQVHVQV